MTPLAAWLALCGCQACVHRGGRPVHPNLPAAKRLLLRVSGMSSDGRVDDVITDVGELLERHPCFEVIEEFEECKAEHGIAGCQEVAKRLSACFKTASHGTASRAPAKRGGSADV
eukprot:PLAT2600.1.p2 GENE.PLAT2600.1~~PLAT2600.1.p2  ORF type:complete len:115 (-),score=26.21 PLAT2600.1:31-375(-)